jgi:hypothetical protein
MSQQHTEQNDSMHESYAIALMSHGPLEFRVDRISGLMVIWKGRQRIADLTAEEGADLGRWLIDVEGRCL